MCLKSYQTSAGIQWNEEIRSRDILKNFDFAGNIIRYMYRSNVLNEKFEVWSSATFAKC